MAKKQPENSNLPDSSDSSNASGTDETTENSEITSETDESNLRANNGSLLESKMNSKDTFAVPAIKLDTPTFKLDTPSFKLDTPSVKLDTPALKLDTPTVKLSTPSVKLDAAQPAATLKIQKDNVTSHTFRLEDLNLGLEAGSGGQASQTSKQTSQQASQQASQLASQQASHTGKQQPIRMSSRQQRILKNLKRNLKRNAKTTTSTTPTSPLKRNSLNELVDMMMQFNLVPKSGVQPASVVKSSTRVSSGTGNEPSSSARVTRVREFAVKTTPGRGKQTSSATSQSLPTRPTTISFEAGPMPSYRESPINSFYSIYPMMHRPELLDTRILFLFEQIVNLLDRFLVLITDFREEVAQLENRDIALDRMIFQENNSVLLEAVTNTLPDRLGERFGRELEKALKKYLGDKPNKKQK